MTTSEFAKMFNDIDPKFIDEASFVEASRSKNHLKYLIIAASLILILAVGSYPLIAKSNIFPTHGGSSTINSADENKAEVRGKAFESAEIVTFVNQNKDAIALNVSAEYNCFGKEINISTKGYYHTTIGKKNITDLGYLTLPICVDKKIVAAVEVYRVDGVIEYTLNAGGNRWEKMNEAVGSGQKTMFAFVGDTAGEIALTSDGKIHGITTDSSDILAKDKNWFEILSSEYNTISLDELNDPNCYITSRAVK